jgi:hypothetical protein
MHHDHVCRLNKSPYGLKQAPHVWYCHFSSHLLTLGFVGAYSDTSLFIYRHDSNIAYPLLHVDDIVLATFSTFVLRQIIRALIVEFSMKDLSSLHHFLGVSMTYRDHGLFFS